MDTAGKERAALFVAAVMRDKGMDERALVMATRLDRQTVATFLGGETWPQTKKRVAIEEALGVTHGSLEAAARGVIKLEEEGDPVESAIWKSRLSRGNKHKLIGIYADMLEAQDDADGKREA